MNPLILAPTTLNDTPPLEFIDVAAETGYDGIGIRLQKSPNNLPYHPVVGDAPLIREIKRRIDDGGLSVLDIFTFYLLPDTNVADFAPALEVGAEIGAKFAVIQGNDPDRARLRANFVRFCETARPLGITASIEFVPARVIDTLQETMRFLAETKQSNAAIMVDPLHLIRSEGDASELKGLDAKLFPYAQFTDGLLAQGEPSLKLAKTMGVAPRCMPGDGVLPLDDIFAALPADIPLSIEIIMDWPDGVTARDWAKRVMERTREFVGQGTGRKDG